MYIENSGIESLFVFFRDISISNYELFYLPRSSSRMNVMKYSSLLHVVSDIKVLISIDASALP